MDDRESEGSYALAGRDSQSGTAATLIGGLAMTVAINVLSEALGAEVVGLHLWSPVAESDVAAIQRAFLEH